MQGLCASKSPNTYVYVDLKFYKHKEKKALRNIFCGIEDSLRCRRSLTIMSNSSYGLLHPSLLLIALKNSRRGATC